MTQDDKPAPAVVVEEPAVIEYVPPSPPRPAATPKSARRKTDASAPDPFAVGVRVLKLAPAWLLFTAVCCSSLVLLLGWIRPAGNAAAALTLPSKHNDARPAERTAAAALNAKAPVPAASPVNVADKAAPAAAPAKVEEKAQPAAQAQSAEAGGKFTAQVGSHSDQSEANEQVSRLRAAGFDARAVAAELPGRGTWYRVQVGRFAGREEAAKTATALRAKGAATAAIVVPLQN
jgi:DedD protein